MILVDICKLFVDSPILISKYDIDNSIQLEEAFTVHFPIVDIKLTEWPIGWALVNY